ncbi:stimulus-sensing domain-containing protein [Nitratireductor sp. XY-223]|uniref:stimulus-sensing domain-containing protein n=1 Tax=Nitratireductor sp. XY-223 TaxID=2561926 RepID=UPI0010AAAC20|nr:stimulus-sensing domain-containing protein [Nitratireductor sp. XY-223]
MTANFDHSEVPQERTAEEAEAKTQRAVESRPWTYPFALISRALSRIIFSSLTRRILFLNLAALLVLLSGILYLNQFREGLIDARVESLLTQGEIIAAAIAGSASVETDSITIDPEKLLELQAGESISPGGEIEDLEFPINPERVAPVLRRLISPTRTRARIYDRDASLILDSQHLYSAGQILRYDLPPLDEEILPFAERLLDSLNRLIQRADLPTYQEQPGGDGTLYEEVLTALTGGRSAVVRATDKGELIVSVAVPVQRFRAVLGVLLLSTQAGDIDKIVRAERLAIVRVFIVAAAVTILLSLLLAGTIANPLHRLADAAQRVRRGVRIREEIPDFSARQDEIGNLSVAVRDMTNALYDRIDAIESFAADVSHELKNPLTSLRSAVETLPLARNDDSRRRLLDVILHDVSRLDRLISDISDASRLDAELARQDAEPVNLRRLLEDLVSISSQIRKGAKLVRIDFEIDRETAQKTRYVVTGHDLRIGQVVTNLIENARSFVPDIGGRIRIRLTSTRNSCLILVEDNGPGISAENIDHIFRRFYTDRPEGEAFGQNSGLGLSISRQIIEAHGGTLTAENMVDEKTGQRRGARFIVHLPLKRS